MSECTEMELMVKLNNKVFTILTKIPGRFMDAVCPTGIRCKISPDYKFILHRDLKGKLQSELVIS